VAEVDHEPRDVNVRTVAKAAVGLGVLAAFSAGVSLGVYVLLRNVHRANDPAAAPLAAGQGRRPPVPRLQAAPRTDLEQLRAEQMRRLTSYGWTDHATGAVHIPIEQAMKLYAQRAGGAPPAPAGADAQLDRPAEAAGASGTATMPPVAPERGASPAPPGGSRNQ
jgi:hypothetical protein